MGTAISYRQLERSGSCCVKDDKGEVPLYVFRDVPRQLNEYEEMSAFHQTSPESGFTKRWICSKATRDGRITVANRRLIITAADRREETVRMVPLAVAVSVFR